VSHQSPNQYHPDPKGVTPPNRQGGYTVICMTKNHLQPMGSPKNARRWFRCTAEGGRVFFGAGPKNERIPKKPTKRSEVGFAGKSSFLGGCGDRIRTDDLRVMSPTSCHCSTPRAYYMYIW
jgi:hypothetical protein